MLMRFAISIFCLLLLSAVAGPQAGAAGAQEPGRYQGKLLVSTSRNGDPRFNKTVLYMVRHTSKSSFGIVVNKPYGKGKLADMMRGLGLDPEDASGELSLHYGGPVAVNHLFFLHSSDYVHEKSNNVDGTVSFTKDFGILKAFAAGTGPKNIHVSAGYAGWSAGQLESEITRGFWKVVQSSHDLVFGTAKDDVWEKLMDREEIPL